MSMAPPEWWTRMPARRRTAAIAAVLLAAGVALFFVAGGAVWLKVFSGVMVGAGGTRLVLTARQSSRAGRALPR